MILHATIEAFLDLAAQVLTSGDAAGEIIRAGGAGGAGGVGDVCAKAPAGVEPYVADVLGWVKYGVIAIIIGCGFASIGAMVVGKIGSMGRAAQVGASGLFWTVLGAIAFVVIYGILNGIVGNGC